jgi:hypothetical protein
MSGHVAAMLLCSGIFVGYGFSFDIFYHTSDIFISALKVCVYLMSRVVLHMDLEDGVNITVQELVQSVVQEEKLGLPRVAANIFTLWMCSSLLGIHFGCALVCWVTLLMYSSVLGNMLDVL